MDDESSKCVCFCVLVVAMAVVINRLGGSESQKVCYHWRAGRCNRSRCPYLHRELPSSQTFKNPNIQQQQRGSSKWVRDGASNNKKKCCHYWMVGKCCYGDNCRFQHQWSLGDSFSLMTQLAGHEKGINAIALPSGSDKLLSAGKDQTVRVWDCNSGQCAGVVNMEGEIGSMISEGPWVFVGAPNVVKAWNIQTNADLSLSGPVGQVYALAVGYQMLFAGTQDGTILVWRFSAATNTFEPAASLKGHNLAAVSLVVGADRLYSGSMDHTVRVWDLETMQCMHVLTEHKDVVTSVLCWEDYLISCSLDRTIKVWAATESLDLEVIYTHNEECGVLTLCGVHAGEGKPVLMCSCNDNIVRLYDLPSFNERGRIFSKEGIRAIQIFSGGQFFTGDGAGQLKVWKWSQ